MAKVLLGVTGGIAAYKACELTRLLVKAGHDVVPLVTRGADRFVQRETFAALARRPAKEDLYPHLTRADLLVVAPLTANTMAKLAYGLADDVLTEAALAHRGPVLLAPAMNPRMWSHPATQANAATLRARGVELLGPDEGRNGRGRARSGADGGAGGDLRASARAARCRAGCVHG
jgi:phosphopantothenoylcysteine decarboxylase/phosphopantothenate--cysteine ligase